jgi:SAM-dependent methyltransferase
MPEFDNMASSYEELLKDPIRDRFSNGTSFFHERKMLLIKAFWASAGRATKDLSWIDIGCGKGDLLRLGATSFGSVAGCDVSQEMMVDCAGLDVRLQRDPTVLPFPDASADFVTAVCVYHHVRPDARTALTSEIRRILRPGGVLGIIEHNPWNPVTRIIVNRTPVDADAILMHMPKTKSLMKDASMRIVRGEYFLYLPQDLFYRARWFESMAKHIPLGGQYVVFGEKR